MASASTAIKKPKLNVHNFPRPPLLERTQRHLSIQWNGQQVLSTDQAYWVLETTHPPTYYIPRSALSPSFVLERVPQKTSLCEWKGQATYWNIRPATSSKTTTTTSPQNKNDAEDEETVKAKIWSYESPTRSFTPIAGYLSFYASNVPWTCFVDGEQVEPQPGDFYGGWKTSDIEGAIKGGPGTWGW